MNAEDEKYRIKPRKKYARQVWLMNGKAYEVQVQDIDFHTSKNEEYIR